jgi:carboxymethylenebutenolidase
MPTSRRHTISTADGSFTAYEARPEGSGPFPGVVVIQEIFGVNAVMRETCDALARQGFLAVCPDLFWRIEPGVDITDHSEAEWKKAFALYNAFDIDKGIEDIQATIDHVRAHPDCTGKVGAVGYCLGGLLAFLTATRTDADAAVAYYGVGIDSRLAEAEKLTRPLLLHIAEEDGFVPKTAQEQIKSELHNLTGVQIFSYPGRDHGFARQGGQHFHQQDAGLANERSVEFLRRALG